MDGKHKVGAAIPVWHLVKILPESLDQVGEQLFGADYWRILRQVSAQTGEITLNEYERAFRACCANPDRYPAEYSLWGCAVTLREFESDSDPSRLLSRFLTALGIPGYAEKPAAGPGVAPASGGNSIHVPPTQVYRQLIIRVVRRLASRRDDAGGKGGDRYWLEVHTAELDACPQACCDRGGKECAPYTARALPTIYARRTEEERRTGLKELLQEEIQDILAAFGSHIPDLIQFVAPEELLAGLIVTDQIDQVRVRDGREPLAEWRPTIFSGARLSNAADAGRDLIERLNSDSPLQGGVINLNSAELTRQVRGQLKEAIVAVLSTPEAVRALLPDAPFFVPFVLVSAEKADAVVAKVTGLHCKRRIAQEMHAQQYDSSLPERLPIIINTPNIEIRFAEAEEPVIVGN